MKNIILTTILVVSCIGTTKSQVAIGKQSVTNTDVSLEFADTENRGILLPWVSKASDVAGAVDGTFIYDTTDKKVK